MSDRVTMADVARTVGVSLMTVSRVINRRGDVSDETRQRVLEAIEQLGYRPSSIARGLATSHTGTLGLVVPDVANPFFSDVARGVEHIAYAASYSVFLCNTEEDPAREWSVLESLDQQRVDGIILCSSRLGDTQLDAVCQSDTAVVLVNRRPPTPARGVAAVMIDDVTGARCTVEHFLERGHQAIAFLAGPANSWSAQRRMDGYRAALRDAGVAANPGWILHAAPNVEGGQAATVQLLSRHPELTALFCYNDLVAIGCLRACAELGIRVPDQLAVAGFDDIPLAALVTPALTTHRVPRYQLGVHAVKALLDQITGAAEGPGEILVRPELILRASAP